jgi:hypothetical protein
MGDATACSVGLIEKVAVSVIGREPSLAGSADDGAIGGSVSTSASGALAVRGATQAVLRILQDVRSDPAVVRAAADAARGGKAQSGSVLPQHRVMRDVQALLDTVIAVLRKAPDRDRFAAHAEHLAVDLADRGVSLAALLTGVQAARSIVLEGLILRLRELLGPEELVAALAALDAEVAPVMTRMVVAHQAAERNLARGSGASRGRSLRRLLYTGDRAAAEELGMDPRGRYHCLVADVTSAREAAAVDQVILTGDGASALVDGVLCRVTSHLPTVASRSVLVVGSPSATLEELPLVYSLGCQALDQARRRGHVGLRMIGEYAIDLAVRGQPLLGRLLTDELLAGLDTQNPFHRQLAETAHVYLSHGGRLEVTSALLNVHPNTVSHRLRRLAALTGFSHGSEVVGDLAVACRWWWALDGWLARSRPGVRKPREPEYPGVGS